MTFAGFIGFVNQKLSGRAFCLLSHSALDIDGRVVVVLNIIVLSVMYPARVE